VYSSLNFIRTIKVKRIKWTGSLTCIGGIRNKNTILEEKSEVRGSFTRHACGRENNVKMDGR
jgi:hypothetical protein